MLKEQHIAMTHYGYRGNTTAPIINRPILNVFRDEPEFHEITLLKPELKKEWYKEELANFNLNNIKKIQPNIDSVPVFARHKLINKENVLVLHLPQNHLLKYYLIPMYKILNKIKNYYLSNNKEEALDLLGHYIQLFVIGHPFEKVNFSICMIQINTLLNLFFQKDIYHEYLDFKCFLLDTKVIIKEFKKMIRKTK